MNDEDRGKRLLVVDDDDDICEIVAEVAEGVGFVVATISDARVFEATYCEQRPHVVVLDLNMPGTDGIELLRVLGENKSAAAVFLMSGVDNRTLASAQRLGKTYGLNMLGALQKPIQISTLEDALSGCL
ncbi:response regulator [Thiococcus pfennigii]|uniref:response regulator n=1 Tax=Thiococcus pfennigii TaxID=1057 RepID=UPI001906419F|nr:response regulator [Thiococcus pfennigii]MBK1699800.1 hypothetical protein [Thiococcus pfennigii]